MRALRLLVFRGLRDDPRFQDLLLLLLLGLLNLER